MQRNIRSILIFFITLSLVGCSAYDFSRREVEQGNLLPQSKMERLKIGMSKEDATALLGTSLLSPNFNNDRWDYAYTWRRGSGPLLIKRMTLYFTNGTLARIDLNPELSQ